MKKITMLGFLILLVLFSDAKMVMAILLPEQMIPK